MSRSIATKTMSYFRERTVWRFSYVVVCLCLTLASQNHLWGSEEENALAAVELLPSEVRIVDRDARVQLQVSSQLSASAVSNGLKKDLTREVTFLSEPSGLVNIDSSGLVTPIASGEGEIVAMVDGQPVAKGLLKIELPEQEPLVNFPNQIVPL
ncbi:MAG: hypothetical protein MUC83_09065, partial [Pirellula sp.]|nr:hypothetical protein [Pirellula sp.]